MHSILIDRISVPEYRMRREFDEDAQAELCDDIAENGLYNPIVVRRDPDNPDAFLLVQGERRLRALRTLVIDHGLPIRYGQQTLQPGHIPVNFLGDLEPLKALELELAENVLRVNLSWQEVVDAQAKLHELRAAEQAKQGMIQRPADTAREIYGGTITAASPETARVREALLIAPHLNDSDVRSAKSQREALRIIEKKQRSLLEQTLAEKLGENFSAASPHTLHLGDAFTIVPTLPDGTFDVILTDPPYGMGADAMPAQSGSISGVKHTYRDDLEFGEACTDLIAREGFRITKPQAHCYMFCRIDLWPVWCAIFKSHGWYVWPVPLIWAKPNAGNLMGEANGPRHSYDAVLYAIKGNRPVRTVGSDVLAVASPKAKLHAAEKPVELYSLLLGWSASPGDHVIDPFCGSGTIFPAASGLSVFATGIELSPEAYATAKLRQLGQDADEQPITL